MKTKQVLLSALLFLSACTAFAWGPKGHAVVADVAASHISRKAAKKIENILDGHTMVDVSSWMDGLRGIPKYEHVRTCSYLGIPLSPSIHDDTSTIVCPSSIFSIFFAAFLLICDAATSATTAWPLGPQANAVQADKNKSADNNTCLVFTGLFLNKKSWL